MNRYPLRGSNCIILFFKRCSQTMKKYDEWTVEKVFIVASGSSTHVSLCVAF